MISMDMHTIDKVPANQSNSHLFFKVLERVMVQVEYHCFADLRYKRIDPFYKELCCIITEVLVLNSDSTLKINGCDIDTFVVQDIYSQIRNHHLRLVFDKFNNVTHRVYNKKAYLRTALYNVFFEFESHHINDAISI